MPDIFRNCHASDRVESFHLPIPQLVKDFICIGLSHSKVELSNARQELSSTFRGKTKPRNEIHRSSVEIISKEEATGVIRTAIDEKAVFVALAKEYRLDPFKPVESCLSNAKVAERLQLTEIAIVRFLLLV